MKIYTKTGDKGETSLFGGKRVMKSHLRVNAYGSIDELNSVLGMVLSKLNDERVEVVISSVQKDLFEIGSYLALGPVNMAKLRKRAEEMEKIIDGLSEKLPEIHNFILPDGVEIATLIFFARAVARRAERELVTLSIDDKIDESIIVYLNRLSDCLFIIARYLNYKAGKVETVWKDTK